MIEKVTSISFAREQAFIERLPDEVLEAIFLLNTLKEYVGEDIVHDPHRTTIATILVCKRWYNIALGFALLWGRIIDYEAHQPYWIEELLRRSKLSPIDVGDDSLVKHVRLWKPRGKVVLSHIFKHSQTLRTLNLQITVSPWDMICKEFLQHPAPALEYLNLVTSSPFPDSLFPGPLFADDAPLLRSLRLQRCLINFSSSALSNLTELAVLDVLAPPLMSMRTPDHPLKIAPTVNGWLRVLEQMPSLMYLTLGSAISHSANEEQSKSKVELPNLRFLSIGARFPDGTKLLNHLKIPPPCGIRLRFSRPRSVSGAEESELLSYLSNRLSYWPEGGQPRYLQAKILTGNRIHFGNSRRVGFIWDVKESDVIGEHAQTSSDPLTWLVLSFEVPEKTLSFFNRLLSLYEPTYSTTASLDLWVDDDFVTPTTATLHGAHSYPSLDILRSFPAVKVLNLLERSPLHLLPLLQTASLSGVPLLPSLRSLRLTRANFKDAQRSLYYTIIAFLIWRTQVHVPIAELQVIDCTIDSETEDALSHSGNVKITHGTLNLTAEDDSDAEV